MPYAVNADVYWYDGVIHFGLTTVAMFVASLILRRFDIDLARRTFWVTHLMVPIAILLLMFEWFDFPPIFIIAVVIFLYSMRTALDDGAGRRKLCYLLYGTFTAGVLAFYSSMAALMVSSEVYFYTIPVLSAAFASIFVFTKEPWKSWTARYFIPYSLICGFILANKWDFHAMDYALLIVDIATILFVLHKSGSRNLAWLPLLLLFPGSAGFYRSGLNYSNTAYLTVLISLFAALRLAGQLLYDRLFGLEERYDGKMKRIFDWYSAGCLVVLAGILDVVTSIPDVEWIKLIPPVLLSLFLYSQRMRVGEGTNVMKADTVWIVSLLLIYETLAGIIDPPEIIASEMMLLPLAPMAAYLSKKVWKGFEEVGERVELAVLLFIFAVLFKDLIVYELLTDAVITGLLSIAMIGAGMQLQKRAYFIVGSGTLVLNFLLQTKEFWRSLPWWTYLLIAGLILIGIASYNELRKRK